MKKRLIGIVIRWTICGLCLIMTFLLGYINKQNQDRKHLSIVIYEKNNKHTINSNECITRAYFDNKFECLISAKSDNNKIVAWFYTYNGPVKLKRDKTNKFFVISKATKVSVWGSLGNDLNYTWFTLWH